MLSAKTEATKPDELKDWLAKVESWVAARDDCQWFASVNPSLECRVAGVVEQLKVDPGRGTIEITLTDGRDTARAWWPATVGAPQFRAAPRSGVILEGIPLVRPGDGLAFENPRFIPQPGPEDE